ncbi:MAG: VWA domain-containing protein, partial [Bacteroidota bacterium]
MLDVYNHHKYGMLAYYNRFLSFSDMPMVKMIEEPPFFRVIYSLDREQSAMLAVEKVEQAPDTTSLALYAYRRTKKEQPKPAAKPRKQVPQETIVASADNRVIAEASTPIESASKTSDTDTLQTAPSIAERLNRIEIEQASPATPQMVLPAKAAVSQYQIAKAATNHLIFLVDVSSSMNKPEKLPLLQESLYELVKMMRPEDHITLIAYSGKAVIVLEATSSAKEDYIFRNLSTLSTGGKTNVSKGLKLAYKLAQKHYVPGGNNRVILASDGMVN